MRSIRLKSIQDFLILKNASKIETEFQFTFTKKFSEKEDNDFAIVLRNKPILDWLETQNKDNKMRIEKHLFSYRLFADKYSALTNFDGVIMENNTDKQKIVCKKLAGDFAQIYAASSLGYTISKQRLMHGLESYYDCIDVVHRSLTTEDRINYITSLGYIQTVSNGVEINSPLSFIKFNPTHTYVDVGVTIRCRSTETTFECAGNKEEAHALVKGFKEAYPNTTFEITSVDSIGPSGANERNQLVDFDDINTVTADFYPWLDKDPVEMFDDYFASNKTVLIMIGPPGTGKTTLCRNLIKRFGKKTMIANNETLFDDSRLLEHYASSECDMLLIEDADNILRPRENKNSAMSYLLNLTDGIIPLNKKFVIVTNLPSTRDIDQAVMRPGRCYDIIEFKPLSSEEAASARSSIGLPELDMTVRSHWTLAEALNYDLEIKIEKRRSSGFGFTG